ncbi:MAG TPA: SDR family NAD(P)-dependent oxidoreductase [Acidimicrobiia bacterium]|nr:SDR family NAD(P)-dependent oxidoreductase [Acidimicrobiia bacterium]
MLRFDGLVALVTGAGRGLGREHARLLAARGAALVVNDRPGSRDVAAVVDEIVAAGGRAVGYEGDVAEPGEAASVVASALATFGRIDAVIANAGVLRSADLADTDDALWDEVVGVNLRGAFATARAAWPSMTAQGSGRVVFTTSNSGLLGVPGSSAYAASKAGLWGLTRVLALEGSEHGIGVNAIAPIAFTAMSAGSRAAPESWRTGTGDAWAERLAPELVAPVVGWLAHPECTLNGEILSVAGGRVARFFLGLTPGVVDDALTVESVRAHEEEIVREDGYEVLARAAQEATHLHRRVMR